MKATILSPRSQSSTPYLLALALLLFIAQPLFASTQATFYVSPTGSDSNTGTLTAPFQTITAAQTAVRAMTANMTGNIVVYLRAGVYQLSAPLTFGIQDSGTNGFNVIYQAYNNEVPVISGGVPVTGWTQVSGNIYSAPLSRSTKLRSLFVNGVRATMTKSGAVQGYGNESVFTIPSTASYSINGATGSEPDDVQFAASAVGFYANSSDIELVQNYTFNSTIVTVRNIVNYGGNPDFQLQEPYGALAGSMLYTTGLNPGGAFYVQNAYELLKSPGQFYFNRATQTLYYYSRGENMATAQVIAPTTEGLMQIHGASNTNRVANLQFLGITFAYDHWQMYNVAGSYGMAATQSVAGQVAYAGANNWHGVTYNDTENPQASIDLQNANGIVFQGDSFEHLSSGSAVGLTDDVINSTVLGNDFVDLSGNAITVGNAQNAYPNTSRLYPPNLWGVCTNNILQDNLIRNPNQLYYQFEGIAAVYVNGLKILHNDIGATGYDSITLGWGWNVTTRSTSAGNNTVSYNRANQSNQIVNEDGGSLYFLGQQPNTTISNNYISNGLTGLYEDAGSAYLTIENNVISNEGWLYISDPSDNNLTVENNYYNTNVDIIYSSNNITVANNTYQTTFGTTAQAIIAASGLEPSYQYLLSAPVVSNLISANGAQGAVLSWQNTGVATSFNIYRGTSAGAEGSTPYRAGVSGSAFIDTGISAGSTYYYKVTAVGLAGETAASNEVSYGITGTTPQMIAFNPIPSQVVGGTLTVSATASSGLPVTFTVVQNGNCSISGNVVTFLNVGNCGVIASQAGNNVYNTAPQVGQIIAVNNGTPQTISFGAIATQTVGTPLALSATASSGLAVSFSATPSTVCTVSVSTVMFVGGGSCTITASQSGNSTYSAATPVSQTFTVKSNQSFTLLLTSPSVTIPSGGQGAIDYIDVTPAGGFSGAVTLSANLPSGFTDAFLPGNTTTTSSEFVIVAQPSVKPGAYVIPISGVSGSLNAAVNLNVTVTGTQTITFNSIATQTVGTPLTLAATASSGLAVSYTASPSTVCTLSGATVTFVGAGTCTITASQAGNSYYSAATSVSQSFTVKATGASFTLSAATGTLSQVPGASNGVTDAITVNPANGFTGTVAFSVSGIPAGVDYAFVPASSTSGTTFVIYVPAGVAASSNNKIVITGTSGVTTAQTTVTLNIP